MEVILKENYPSLGYVGDKVKVRNGFARNFLIPKGIAIEASSRNAKLLAHKMQGVVARKLKLKAEASELGTKLAPVVLEYRLKAGDGGKTYGSIHPKDVEASLTALGYSVSKTQIRFHEPIKKAGEFRVTIKLHSDVSVELPVKVTAEVVKSKESAGDETGKPKRKGKKKVAEESAAEGTVEGEKKVAAEATAPAAEEAAPAGKPKKERKKKEAKAADGAPDAPKA